MGLKRMEPLDLGLRFASDLYVKFSVLSCLVFVTTVPVMLHIGLDG